MTILPAPIGKVALSNVKLENVKKAEPAGNVDYSTLIAAAGTSDRLAKVENIDKGFQRLLNSGPLDSNTAFLATTVELDAARPSHAGAAKAYTDRSI